jgi:N-acetylmuramoyl-L-alanine amidase
VAPSFLNIKTYLIIDKRGDSAISKREFNTGEKTMFYMKRYFVVLFALFLLLSVCGVSENYAAERKHLIIIDAAHGGKDEGLKLNDKVSEKDVTLAVALILQKELATEKNLEVVLTRDSDKTVSPENRKKIIEKNKPEFFLSLHVNGGFGKSASGFEIYYPGFGQDSTGQEKKAKDEKAQLLSKSQNDSLKMAKIIQDNLNKLFPRKNRGIRKADLAVIDDLMVPSLIVEMGFATNAEDKKKLISSKTQAEIAQSLAKSVKTFFR